MFRFTMQFMLAFSLISASVESTLAGGRPNSISGGQNAFAGVVNPANAVWIEDRFDIGFFGVHQRSSFDNQDNNPLFPPGKTNQAYKVGILTTADAAIHKRTHIKNHECSFSLATYITPGYAKVRTKEPLPLTGTTPISVENKTQVFSSIFSLKFN